MVVLFGACVWGEEGPNLTMLLLAMVVVVEVSRRRVLVEGWLGIVGRRDGGAYAFFQTCPFYRERGRTRSFRTFYFMGGVFLYRFVWVEAG